MQKLMQWMFSTYKPDDTQRDSVSGEFFSNTRLESVIRDHPNTTFVVAHVGSYAENLPQVSKWLEQYPNKRSSGNGHASAKHCKSVQWLFDHRRRHFVVMDSDILIKADISPLWDERYAWVGQESLHRSRYGNLMRVEPALCYINMPMVHEHGVSFLNPAKMYALTGDRKSDAYDTGCWFHEDCKAHGLPTLPVSLDDYAVHMAHGSWKRTAKMVQQFIEDNRALWE